MRSFILAVVAVFALPFGPAQADDLDQPETQAELCQKGVLFESLESGGVVTIIRHGFGYAYFTMERDHLQPAMAAEILTKEGEHRFIYGPMRSYMFAVDPETLKDFAWRPEDGDDPNAFYTIRADDGEETLLTLTYVGCAP